MATALDLATRMIVGWQLADHMRTSLFQDALDMAITHGKATSGSIFHSDHGSVYTSDQFTQYCRDQGIVQSMGRTGVCWDNAVAESFFATLKNEMYHQYVFATRAHARFAVAEYIEVYYNRTRLHSSLDYTTPAQAWAHHETAADEAA